MLNPEKLIDASALLVSTLETGEILPRAMEIIKTLLDCEAASIMLLDPVTQDLIFEVALGEKGKILEKVTIPRGKGIAGEVALTGEAKIIDDAPNYRGFDPSFDKKTGFKTKAVICVPLKLKESILGTAQAINPAHKARFDDEDLDSLALFANQVTLAIEASRLHNDVLAQKSLENELNLARSIQESFLPQTFPQNDAFEVYAKTAPARYVGGDFYSVFDLGKNRFGFAVGDVSGKGMAAAIFMARVLSDLEISARDEKNAASCAGVLERLNAVLASRKNTGMFVTLLFAVLDATTRKLRLASAGHPRPYLWSAAQAAWQEINVTNGWPAGIAPLAHYADWETTLKPGDRIFFFTDALSEAPEKNGKAPMGEFLRRAGNTAVPLKSAGEDVFAALKALSPTLNDDATILLLGIK